ncbi:UDP-N-acetyl-D-mannosamine dehydrogenase [Mycoavidus sp. B2-EB]|uniref:UDP-N-acetyl-D-mannosamine dehydrogenase n=1 Tax=Mycoavidus sp. B2-EB TaxID=2651972 RepID=UPI001627C4FC|nr:UDP-N-acetyl-D-mannosamine dehydrogenase [Mycoavidus sp. B2-EB]BBO60036.1 UDP-N-acetyl-D-mannosamine dehydrogenase [Mycoavidus sp. B2-EB]
MRHSHFKKVCVIGLGYIGLPTAAMFASRKIRVAGIDIDQYTIDTINEGKIHIIEPELDIIVHAVVKEGYLKASAQPEAADAFVIAVPTPSKEDHSPDLSYVRAAAESIAPVLKQGDLVILESTSPVGTTDQMISWLKAARADLSFPTSHHKNEPPDINIAYCPERVLPGQVIRELVQNDRIIGGVTANCAQRAQMLYRIFVTGELLTTNARTAEMAKLTENAFRDVNIAFANELSLICDQLKINVWELIKLTNHHPRVNVLQPGPGVGGHCIAVDPWFIVNKTPEQAKLIRTAREINDYKPEWVVNKVNTAIDQCLANGKRSSRQNVVVALLGLAFKPNIDDFRESPAVHIARKLVTTSEARFILVEPFIDELPAELASARLANLKQAIAEADVVALLVKHDAFKAVAELFKPSVLLIDVVGLLEDEHSR